MFFVARPQHPQHPQSMFRTMAADVPYSHYPYSPSHLSSYYGADEAYLEAQYAARLRARQRDEMMRQRARAAAVRAQQRREYEHELAMRAAEEEAYRRYVARVRAQEAIVRQAEARRVAEAEHARRVAASRAKTAAFQRLIRTMLAETVAQKLASKAQKTTAEPSLPVPAQALPSAPTTEEKNVEKLLQDRAKTESDDEVLVTLNGLLQALASAPTAPTSAPTSTSSTTEATTAAAFSTVQCEPKPSTPSTPVHSRKPSFETLDRLSSTFSELTKTFTLPAADFSRPSTPARSDSPTTHLAFTPANRPIHEYEAALGKLLAELDAVESDGDVEVRERRRELVKNVEAALAELDGAIEAQRLAREVQPAKEVEEAQHVKADDAEEVAVIAANTASESVPPVVNEEVLAPAPVHVQHFGFEVSPSTDTAHEDIDGSKDDVVQEVETLNTTPSVQPEVTSSTQDLPVPSTADYGVTGLDDTLYSNHTAPLSVDVVQHEVSPFEHDSQPAELAPIIQDTPSTMADPITDDTAQKSMLLSTMESSATLSPAATLSPTVELSSPSIQRAPSPFHLVVPPGSSSESGSDQISVEDDVVIQPSTILSSARAPSPWGSDTDGPHPDEEALLLDGMNSDGEWSEVDA